MMDFQALAEQGQTVIYQETADAQMSPGDGWEYWGDRATPEGTVAVWRRVVTFAEAESHQAAQQS